MDLLRKIQNVFCKIKKVEAVKVFSFTAMATLIRMLTGFISIKFVSVLIGPSGIALLGQLNNFSSIVMTLASSGINSGVVKYVASEKDNKDTLKLYLSTAIRIVLFSSLLCGLFLILGSSWLSEQILFSGEYQYVFIIFGFTVILYALNSLLNSILNGHKEFKLFTRLNMMGSLFGLLFSLALVWILGLKGALISAVTFQSIMFFISLWMARNLEWMKKEYFVRHCEKDIAKKYSNYTLMAFVSAATVPVSQMLLRSKIINQLSIQEAGLWEGMNRLSGMYLMVITTSLSIYYLPRLSELINKENELRKEILGAYKLIIPALILVISAIYLLRNFIISLLFTPDFASMEQLFAWQLIGDFFKMSSWLIAYLMLAKTMTKTFIATEIIFSLSFVILGFYLVRINGVIGVTQAYMINYFTYMVFMLVLFRKVLIK